MSGLFRRKPIETAATRGGARLAPTLSWPHLIALGVGSIVGTGILTLIGTGVGRAGPAILLSFAIAGVICACAALAYSEMATMMPASGGAYTYSYAVLGEVIAWVVGWSLILEYSLVVSTVAVGWSGFAAPLLIANGFPPTLTEGPSLGGIANLPAIFIIAVVAGLLCFGTRESARLNTLLVVIKVLALILFVAVALPAFNSANLHPFMPYGFAKHAVVDQLGKVTERGVMAGAAIIFFAFYGFDAISTAAEETKKPERDLAIGIVGSMLIATLVYVLVGVAAVGAVPFLRFAGSPDTLSLIMREMGHDTIAQIIAISAIVALPTVVLGFLYGQSRIFLVMARDGFLPSQLATMSGRGTPVRITIVTAIVVAVIAGVLPIDQIAALANAGTLIAFMAVAACMLVMRRRAPALRRPFRTPLVWVVGPAAILGCLYLFVSLPTKTLLWCLIWNAIGILIYAVYGRRHSALGQVKAGA
jgi:APA family basic amino acid/polyamine antiporter